MKEKKEKQDKKIASNVVLAGLVILIIGITVVGTVLLQSSIFVPKDLTSGNADVRVNVEKAPQRSTGEVTLNVISRLK